MSEHIEDLDTDETDGEEVVGGMAVPQPPVNVQQILTNETGPVRRLVVEDVPPHT